MRANPVLGMKINVVGTTIVFEVAKNFAEQVQSVVYASSVAVYGPASDYPAGPIAYDAPLLPTTLYGVTKEANEGTAEDLLAGLQGSQRRRASRLRLWPWPGCRHDLDPDQGNAGRGGRVGHITSPSAAPAFFSTVTTWPRR